MLGIFDSGSGGLTVLKEIKKLSPNLDIIYLADFKNIPYGGKSPEELGAFTVSAIERLLQEGALDIVSACNSVSSSVAQPLVDLLGEREFGMIEMVGPTVKKLTLEVRKGTPILLVATEATVRSGIYSNSFRKKGFNIQSVSIPRLVPAIERCAKRNIIESMISKTVCDTRPFDVLVLGCTQYPLVSDIFKEVLSKNGSNATIFNPGEAVAEEVRRRFGDSGGGEIRFLLSSKSPFFEKIVKEDYGRDYKVGIEYI